MPVAHFSNPFHSLLGFAMFPLLSEGLKLPLKEQPFLLCCHSVLCAMARRCVCMEYKWKLSVTLDLYVTAISKIKTPYYI